MALSVQRSRTFTHRARQRGFTLVELLASVVIIAVLAALATPSFIALLRDRRVVGVGIQISDGYRQARVRSLARGIPVFVQWQSTGAGKGTFEIREALVFAPGQGVTPSCSTADWSAGSTNTRRISLKDYADVSYELAEITLFTGGGASSAYGGVCFQPDGPTLVTFTPNTPIVTELTSVPRFEIKNKKTQQIRTVFVAPNGVARMAL